MRGILILIGIGVLVLGIAYLLVDTEPAPPGVQPRAIHNFTSI